SPATPRWASSASRASRKRRCVHEQELALDRDGEDPGLIARSLAGDEAAFAAIVRRHQGSLVRFVQAFGGPPRSVDDVIQETWLAVLRGLANFEARSAFRTWLFKIASNRARTLAVREKRQSRIEKAVETEVGVGNPYVASDRFLPADDPQYPMHWS